MAPINARQVQTLREKTGAGIMDCKAALAAEQGNLERAIDHLRKKGLSAASKKAGRLASEGAVGSYIHGGGRIGVMVEVNCETDFVGRNEDFLAFVKDIAMHIAAAAPQVVRREDLAAETVAREREVLTEQVAGENARDGRKAADAEETLAERLGQFYAETCLMEQPFVKEPRKSVDQVCNELVAKIGEKIVVRRFARFQLGEGLAKRSENFLQEVQRAAAGG